MSYNQLIILAFCLLSSNIYGQSIETINIIDQEYNTPIGYASYEYGNEKGLSGEDGSIIFTYREGERMFISHIQYGTWDLSDEAVQQAITEKTIFLKSNPVKFQPITIIGVRAQDRRPDEELKIEYQDRMEHDGSDILNQLPAFNSIRKGGNYGFDPVFRGFKYDQLNIVLNGAQSATAACPNRMDPPTSQMSPNMMDRIEVLKGPHALRYGTGFGATINFIPEGLKFTDKTTLNGRVSTGYESNGNVIRGESRIGVSGKKYDMNLFGSWSQGDDYTTGNGETVQSDFSRGSFGTDLGFQLTSQQQLRVSATYNRARDADFPALGMDLREDDTWMFSASHSLKLDSRKIQSWNTTFFGSFVDHLMDNLLKPLDPRMLNAENRATTVNYGGRSEGKWLFKNSIFYAGADLRVEGAEGTRVREFLMGPNAGKVLYDNAWQNSAVSKTGLFAEYQINKGSLDYVFSGRLEFNQADMKDPSDEFLEEYPDIEIFQTNPSISLGLMKDLEVPVMIGVWLGRAQRSAGLTERFINYFSVGQDPYEMLGNPELKPEVNNQVDIAIQWQPSERTSLSLDIFGSYLQDYISSEIDPDLKPRLPMSPGVRRFVNIDNAFKTGFEVSWSQGLWVGLHHHLGFAYTYGQNLAIDEPLPEIAPLDIRYAVSGEYFENRLRPQVTFRYVAEQSRISPEFGETVTPTFALLDISIAYQVSKSFSIKTGVNNLLDEAYYEHLNRSTQSVSSPIYAPGRSIYANLNFNF